MSHRLLVNPGTPQTWEIQLKPGSNRIGRGEDNDFVINHPSISTHHCEVTVTDNAVWLKDLGSTNGTFVAQRPVTEAQLQTGQHVQFGAVDMSFESSSAAPVRVILTTTHNPPPPPPPPAPPAGLRITRTHAPEAPAPGAVSQLSAPPAPAGIAGFKAADAPADDEPKRNFALSLTGVFLGALLGMIVWHLIYRFTGWKLGIMALAIGCLAGAAPQVMGHYRSKLMGVIAAFVALSAIFATQYLNARLQFDNFMEETQTELYDSQVTYAKRVKTAVPTGSDEEIRSFLATEYSDETEKVKPEEIEADQITDLRTELPKLRDLADGKTTKAQFNEDLNKGREELEAQGFLRIYFMIRALGLFNIVNIVLGTGAAYLTAKGDR